MDHIRKQTKVLSFKNVQFSYFVMGDKEGDKDKETILMLHPAFADHHIFELQIDYFKDNYQILVLDMPGHGEGQVMGSKVTLKDMPEILNQLLLENSIATCHLLGVSMGSLVAQAFAAHYPARVKSVIIVGGYSIHKANEQILKAQRKEGLKWMLYILFSMKKFRRYVAEVSCYSDSGRKLFAQGMEHFGRRSFSAMAGMNTFFAESNRPVSYPLLIIVGEYDRKLAHDAARDMHELEPHSQFVYIKGAGHCANVDAPREFNDVVMRFLAQLV
jgi:3-oxoadipate enol-lactonase